MEELKVIPIDTISINPFQPRRAFESMELEELSLSIKAVGLIHPPTVRETEGGHYELVSGERRLRASALAGLTQIPVIVKAASVKDSAHAALIENIQRVDLNPMEVAAALKRLMEEFHYTQEELSFKIGKKRSTVANYLRLLTLPRAIQASLREDRMTMGHAKAILSLPNLDQQMILHDWVLRQALSVRAAEEAARVLGERKVRAKPEPQEDLFVKDLEKQLSEKMGTRVTIKESGGKGLLSLHFYSFDDLDRLLERLG